VEPQWLFLQLGAFRLQVIRIVEDHVRREKGDRSHWHIDVENPPPVVIVGEITAERGADDWSDQRRNAEHRHRGPRLLGRKTTDQHRVARWLQPAAGEALNDAKQDDLTETVRHAAQSRGDREYGDRQQKIISTTDVSRNPTRYRQNNGIRREITGDHPLAV